MLQQIYTIKNVTALQLQCNNWRAGKYMELND